MNIGITGHRPQKLGGFSQQAMDRLYKFAQRQLLRLDAEHTIYHGCALGFDMAMAIAAQEQGHKVVSCLPFLGFNAKWNIDSVMELDRILNKSHEVIVVTDKRLEENEKVDWFNAALLLDTRNKFIVNNVDKMLALSCGASSGTLNCVNYAERKSVPVTHLWRDWLKFQNRYGR